MARADPGIERLQLEATTESVLPPASLTASSSSSSSASSALGRGEEETEEQEAEEEEDDEDDEEEEADSKRRTASRRAELSKKRERGDMSPALDADSDGSDEEKQAKPAKRTTKISYITDRSRRHTTFSKRKAGLIKKAYELTTLTGTQALLIIASDSGHVYSFATPKMLPFVTIEAGKSLIQQCLAPPDESTAEDKNQDPHRQR